MAIELVSEKVGDWDADSLNGLHVHIFMMGCLLEACSSISPSFTLYLRFAITYPSISILPTHHRHPPSTP